VAKCELCPTINFELAADSVEYEQL
jgi:hypothetical protein